MYFNFKFSFQTWLHSEFFFKLQPPLSLSYTGKMIITDSVIPCQQIMFFYTKSGLVIKRYHFYKIVFERFFITLCIVLRFRDVTAESISATTALHCFTFISFQTELNINSFHIQILMSQFSILDTTKSMFDIVLRNYFSERKLN